MSVPLLAAPQNLARCDVERSEQRRRSVAGIVVRVPLCLARSHRKQRLRALKRLNLRLFIDAHHDRVDRRAQVEAHDVTHLVDELRIRRELETLCQMRLQPKRMPDPSDRVRGKADRTRHRTATPVSLSVRSVFERLGDDLFNLRVADGARCADARLVEQALQAQPEKP